MAGKLRATGYELRATSLIQCSLIQCSLVEARIRFLIFLQVFLHSR
jgi:hypothetical protein